jgi:predicted MFS family arabinose efflux permease
MSRPPSERVLVFLLGTVQFVNILDFMMVAPMGPDYAIALTIREERIGWIVGAYTVAAAIAGFCGSFFLDRFDRRKALAVSALGLAVGTLSGAFATGLWSLIAARLVAGAFGGPATSIAMSILADLIPAERRGRAIGAMAGAFSAASVIGVPTGLILSRYGGWRLPFVVVAAMGFLVVVFAARALPSMTSHIETSGRRFPLRELFTRKAVVLSYTMTATVMLAGFLLIPNFPAFVQRNLGYPRDRYELLYTVAGAFSFLSMRVAGRAVDRWGSFKVGSLSSLAVMWLVWTWFIGNPTFLPVMAVFILFMVLNAFRNVSYNTLTSKVPRPAERARFMSMQSMVQHSAMGLGAILSGVLLSSTPDGKLVGLPRLVIASLILTAAIPILLAAVESQVKSGSAQAPKIRNL